MPRPLIALVVAIGLAGSCLAGSALAEDWPEFRGPTKQGHSSALGLPTEWSAEKNVRWKTELEGEGWSSPSVVKGRIYLTAAVPVADGQPKDRSLRALCLDAANGNKLWDVE